MGIKYVVRYAFRAPSVNAFVNNDTVDALAARMDPAELDSYIAKGFIIPQMTSDEPEAATTPPQVFGEGTTGASRVEGQPVTLNAPTREQIDEWREQQPPPFTVEPDEEEEPTQDTPRRRATDFAQVPHPQSQHDQPPQDTPSEGGR